MNLKSALRLLVCLLLCLGIGMAGSVYTKPEIAGWYAGLVKPWWTPPPLVFPIVWTTLYVLMGVALWRLWDRVAPSAARTMALGLFGVQLMLNAIWSPVFFGWHGTRVGLVIIIALIVVLAMTIRASARVDRAAAWLLAPYLAWIAYASTINAGVVVLN